MVLVTDKDDEPAEILSIEEARAARFLDALATNPFLAVVIEEGRVRFYARTDIDTEHLRMIRETIDQLAQEE